MSNPDLSQENRRGLKQNRSRTEKSSGMGGVKTYRTLEGGGGTRPESCPWKAWTFGPQIEISQGISVEKGQIQGHPKIENSPPYPKNLLRQKIALKVIFISEVKSIF